MKWLSLFSGIGGFDLALQRQGHEIIGACEIDEYARRIYAKHFPKTPIWEDATKLHPEELDDIDGICAGFPCQTFSIAGNRLGFEESRGTLFFEIARLAKQKRPRILLLENVKGLLSHDGGKTFAEILATLDELGYDAEWQVLNSKYFVPQNRERIFIIAYLRGTTRPQVFPYRERDELPGESGRGKPQGGEGIRGEVSTIDSRYGALRNAGETYIMEPEIKMVQKHDRDTNRVYDTDGIARTLRANSGGMGSKTGLYAVMNPGIKKKSQNGRTVKEEGEPSFTLTAQDKHGVFDGKKVRRLTPLECERLQGFPDGWTEGISDTQRYKCIGNAVTVPVIEFILKRMEENHIA
jgi:DNA (cytosine-5)-methyltransferase 1